LLFFNAESFLLGLGYIVFITNNYLYIQTIEVDTVYKVLCVPVYKNNSTLFYMDKYVDLRERTSSLFCWSASLMYLSLQSSQFLVGCCIRLSLRGCAIFLLVISKVLDYLHSLQSPIITAYAFRGLWVVTRQEPIL